MAKFIQFKQVQILITMLLIAFTGISQAMPYYQGSPMMQRGGVQYPDNRQTAGPGAELRAGMDKLMAFFKSKKPASTVEIMAFLETEIAPSFDFDYMARMAAGPMARHMNSLQQEQLSAKIKTDFLGALVERLSDYSGQSVKYLTPRHSRGGNRASASVAIMNPGGYPSRLEFRFYRSNTGWKVYDVSANGQSAVLHFRRQLSGMIRSTSPGMR